MRKLSFLLIFCLGITLAYAQDSDKVLVKTLNPEGASTIAIDFRNSGIEASPWNKDEDGGMIRLELEIHSNMPETVLAQLVKAGRYTMKWELQGESFHIFAPNLEKTVTIGGKDLEDEIFVIAKTPGYYAVDHEKNTLEKNLPDGVITQVMGRSENLEDAKQQLKKMRQIQEKINVTVRFVYKDKKEDKKIKRDGTPVEAEKESSMMPPKEETNGIHGKKGDPQKELDKVQSKYGDILIDGVPLIFD